MAAGCHHHTPIIDPLDYRRAQFLEPFYLCFEVIGLDIEVDAAVMVHALKFDIGPAGGNIEFNVFVILAFRSYSVSEDLTPEFGIAFEFIRIAVDNQTAQGTFVHTRTHFLRWLSED